MGNVLAEAPERLTALSRQQLKEVGSSFDLFLCLKGTLLLKIGISRCLGQILLVKN